MLKKKFADIKSQSYFDSAIRTLFIILTASSIFLSGCGRKEEGKVRLKYAIFSTPKYIQLEKELIKDFESKNPDIKVELRTAGYGLHHEKIQVEIVAGMAPDLWLTDGVYIMEWAERGVIEELTELFNSKMKSEEYFGLQALRDPEGRLWGIPKEIQTFGLFYNKDIFDRFGVQYPDDSWTWDEVVCAAKSLTKDTDGDGRVDIYGFGQGVVTLISNLIYQYGGSILDEKRRNSLLNTLPARQAIEFGLSLCKQKVMPTLADKSTFSELEMFRMGKLAMCIGNYAYVNEIETTFNYSVALPPKKVNRRCYYDPNALVISRGKSQVVKDAAWRYIEYHSSLEAQIKLGRRGEGLPFNRRAALSVVDTEEARKHNLKVFYDMVDESVDYDVNGCWRKWRRDAFQKEIEKGALGIVPIEEVPDNAHREVQKVLDAYYGSDS